jgi:hypothetical protein
MCIQLKLAMLLYSNPIFKRCLPFYCLSSHVSVITVVYMGFEGDFFDPTSFNFYILVNLKFDKIYFGIEYSRFSGENILDFRWRIFSRIFSVLENILRRIFSSHSTTLNTSQHMRNYPRYPSCHLLKNTTLDIGKV